MKRLFLRFSTLMLTFVIGVYVNALAVRAAYQFIPDVDPRSEVRLDYGPVECGARYKSPYPLIVTETMLQLQSQPVSGQDSPVVVVQIDK